MSTALASQLGLPRVLDTRAWSCLLRWYCFELWPTCGWCIKFMIFVINQKLLHCNMTVSEIPSDCSSVYTADVSGSVRVPSLRVYIIYRRTVTSGHLTSLTRRTNNRITRSSICISSSLIKSDALVRRLWYMSHKCRFYRQQALIRAVPAAWFC